MAVTVTFNKPIKFDEKEVSQIDMDLDSLTGRDISQIKSAWSAEGKFSPVPAADMDFCILIAAKASKMPLEFFESLSAKDWIKTAQEVSNFLLS